MADEDSQIKHLTFELYGCKIAQTFARLDMLAVIWAVELVRLEFFFG